MPDIVFPDHPYLIELLTPKQSVEDFEGALHRFRERYQRILDFGGVVSIPDNPMGSLHFSALEVLSYLEVPIDPERLIVHLNTFHRKVDLDDFLLQARSMGIRYLLVVSGDGGPRLHRLEPRELGIKARTVTAVELLRYIREQYPRDFLTGVAFNHYEPLDHERARLERKIEAGARFIITQPVIGRDERVESAAEVGLPLILQAWMSPKVKLLYECVGRENDDSLDGFDPAGNLRELCRFYPDHGLYLSLLSFKRNWDELVPRSAA